MHEVVNTVNALSEDAVFAAIINRTITEFADDRITKVRQNAFHKCGALTSIYLPNATVIESNAFSDCYALTTVYLPNVTSIDTNGFRECKTLTSIELPNAISIGGSAFRDCKALNKVVIETPSVCRLINTSAFLDMPIASGTGYVYVPDGLVDAYKEDSVWSTYAAQIKPLSELPSDA